MYSYSREAGLISAAGMAGSGIQGSAKIFTFVALTRTKVCHS